MKKSFEVLARKYRPVNFDELIGQESIAQTLSLALDSNRLSHAYLFSGLRGSGKTSTARIFAKALICENGISHMPCGVCQNCISALENRHVDIVEMDAASSRKIDDIRDLIEQTKYKPAIARYKIFIIDEVHMLTKEAFNALLKTLEEPPEYVKFILATTDPLKLPATILSRTQHFRFKKIATNKIINHLSHILNLEQISYENEALEILARSGNGSLRDSLTLLDQAIIYSKNHVDVTTVTDMLGLVDPKFLHDLFNAIFAKDYAKIIEFTKILEDYESEMVVDELIAFVKERLYSNDALFSTLVIERFFRILSDAKSLFAINADGSFVLSLIFFKMVEALKIKEIDQMIESLQKEIQRTDLDAISLSDKQKSQETKDVSKEKTKQQNIVNHTEKIEKTNSTLYNENKYLDMFNILIKNIKDRNIQLGECFCKNVSFISYENNILTWESCAKEDCKKILKHGYPVIKQLVRELFGFNTKIKHTLCSKEDSLQQNEQPASKSSYSDSMIEDTQIGENASCVAKCNDFDTKEKVSTNIKDEPMVAKAIELFEATKITIQSKI